MNRKKIGLLFVIVGLTLGSILYYDRKEINSRTFSFGLLVIFIGSAICGLMYSFRNEAKAKGLSSYGILFRYVIGSAFIIFGLVLMFLSLSGYAIRMRGDPTP